jgi:lipid-A-disaccharide synthase
MKLFFSVGEPSGDLHGANLIAQLRRRASGMEAVGFGGPRMKGAGCELLRDMTDLAVMGLGPVLMKLPEFFRLRAAAERYFDDHRPDAVVLIDFPGFNWHIARAAKEREIPVVYYGLPQLWAWASWRVKKVQQYVDHALCKLPFEEQWFSERGCQATYVGHPYFDELRGRQLDEAFLQKLRRNPSRVVTILPGSRRQEVKSNLPMLLQAAAIVRSKVPGIRLAIASYNDGQAVMARQMVASGPAPVEVFVGRTPELISAADCCLACSGSVSLELLYHAKPSVIVYRVPWLLYQAVRRMFSTRYITLVNLMASDRPFAVCEDDLQPYAAGAAGHEQVLFPEYPTWQDRSEQIAGHAIEWLKDELSRQRLITKLAALRDRVGAGGASATAADYILRRVAGPAPAILPMQQPYAVPLRRAS